MPKFLSNCACNGIPPTGIVGTRYDSRPEIIGKLLKDRHVVRFLKAPDGYGKSTVAFEYASIMFSFEHVFWINCSSPYFLRDLDNGCLVDGICEVDEDVKLVVFDDIPELDPDRSQLFTDLIDGLLSKDCEVLVCVSPSFDHLINAHKRKVVIFALELMLSGDEIEIERLRGRFSELDVLEMPTSEMIPSIVWGGGVREVVSGLRKETLSSQIWLFVVSILIFRKGNLSEIENFLAKHDCDDAIEYLGDDYPLLGIDAQADTFDSIDVPIGLIKECLGAKMEIVLNASVHASPKECLYVFADALIRKHERSRACDLVRNMMASSDQSAWICRVGWRLINGGDPLELVRFADKVVCRDAKMRQEIVSSSAWGLFFMGEMDDAVVHATSALRVHAQNHVAMISALILRCQVLGSLLDMEKIQEIVNKIPKTASLDADHASGPDWVFLAKLMCTFLIGQEKREETITKIVDSAQDVSTNQGIANALVIFAMWLSKLLLDESMGVKGSSNSSEDEPSIRTLFDPDELLVYLQITMHALKDEIIESAEQPSNFGLLLSTLALNIEAIKEYLTNIDDIAFNSHMIVNAERIRARCTEQLQGYRRMRTKEITRRSEFNASHPDPFRVDDNVNSVLCKNASGITPLSIKLFGGLEVRMGGDRVNPKLLSRRKSQIALAMLAMNKGKEIATERLSQTLWPESDTIDRRNNFYSVWSQLKRALKVDGHCPYLIRSQYGCSLDSRYFHTDLEQFDTLCKRLVFGNHSSSEWEHLYAEVTDNFSEDIMPSETENAFISARRNKAKMQLVDGMVRASSRLLAQHEVQGALWFARDALLRCDTREDVYIALMEAQIAANQRSLALETYFQCRKVLIEELGIDPSLRIVELYRSIIETEEVLI